MPELPEVETIRRGLEPAVSGRVIRSVRFAPGGERLLQGVPADAFCARIVGRRIVGLDRRGKYLVFTLDDGTFFVAHLRMTGRIEVEDAAAPEGRFFRAALELDGGRELRWRDVRRFGTWTVIDAFDDLNTRLGPEPLDDAFTVDVLAAALSGRRAPVKSVLLDQRRVAGLGNIYVDEALFEAGIHPQRPAGSLSLAEVERLYAALQAVLRRGIKNFGTTLRDFVNAYGQEGRNREYLQVYQRGGQPCYNCGTSLERTVVGGRGTHFCPHCQPAPSSPSTSPSRDSAA